jgi:hypothetical protein
MDDLTSVPILVLTVQNLVQPMDPHLQNAWRVTNSPGGLLWVTDCSYRLSARDDCNGVKQGLTATSCLPTEQRTVRQPRPGWSHRGLLDHGRLDDGPGDTERLPLGARSSIRSPPGFDRRLVSSTILRKVLSAKASPSAPINKHGNFLN